MRSNLKSKSFLFILSLSSVLALACSKRSGLDRGDANETLLRNPAPNAADSATERRPNSDEAESSEQARFAAPPAEDAEEAPAPTLQPAPHYPNESAASAKSSGVPRTRANSPAAAPSPQAAEPSARSDNAYAAKNRTRDSFQPREERPGLGTSWGETRRSWVSTVSFERDNQYAPTAMTRIFYNDKNGILAQTGQRSTSALGRNQTDLGSGFVTVEIVDPDGYPLPGLISGGRSYVVGHDGDRYAIRIRNNEQYRVEVVATVDGLDVIDGTKGNFGKRGYVIDAYSSVLIEGFRRSTNAVAAFRFGAVSDSYAARTGSDRNVGVIGVALFAERGCCVEPYTQHEVYKRETADPFPSQYARPPRQPLARPQQWAE